MSDSKDLTSSLVEENSGDIYLLPTIHQNNFSTRKKPLKREIYESRLRYGQLSKLDLVLDEVRYFPYFENISEILSHPSFISQQSFRTNCNKESRLKDNSFSLKIRPHSRKVALEKLLIERLNSLETINREISDLEESIGKNLSNK